MEQKVVSENWLYIRAKSIEKKNLFKYGSSLTAGSLCNYLNNCILECLLDLNSVLIDYEKFKEIEKVLLRNEKPLAERSIQNG